MPTTLRLTADDDNIVTVWLDVPGKPVNTCTPQLLDDLERIIDSIEHSNVAGVIFASAKQRSFNDGADLFAIREMDASQIAEFLAKGQAIYNRIAHLNIPTVAAINGDCLGGGMELALTCRHRVAADLNTISIGLPEIKLGLIPAWGGTTRLPRLIGLTNALPILLAGKTMSPKKARKAGLVDEVVRPEALQHAAKRLVQTPSPKRKLRFSQRLFAGLGPLRSKILSAARQMTLKRTAGNYPAPLKLLDVVKVGYERGFTAGLAAERQALLELSSSPACQNLMRLFFQRQSAKHPASMAGIPKPRPIKQAGVVGGGTMGAGIVHALIRAGIPVRLIEVSPAAITGALKRIRAMLDEDIKAGKLDKLAAHHAFNRVSPTTDWSGLGSADIVIEAVLETIEAKRDVFGHLDAVTRHDAILATNTSSLRVADIASATLHPNRVVGLHFFNPVNKMPLVEVVRGPQSDDASLAAAATLANRLGKAPVIVNDAPGFLVNRLLIPHLAEALTMGSEGIPISHIDAAIKDWGMPMGPFELLDEIGLDIALHVFHSLSHVQVHPAALSPAIEQAVAKGWLGKKSGKGFYIHDSKDKDVKPNEELQQLMQGAAISPTPLPSREEIQWRLILPMVNEAARAFTEGVTQSADDIDLAAVLGLGFAPFRGGPAKFADDIGLDEIAERLHQLATHHGPRFAPADLIRNLSARRQPFPRPGTARPVTATPIPTAIAQIH